MVRPLIDIDWKKVDELLISGCNGVQVAGYFAMHPDTFYRRVQQEKKMGFTDYLQEKQSKGEAMLIAKQFAKALGGDNAMLIWLGKARLKQKENEEVVITKAIDEKFNALMETMKQNQALRAADSNMSTCNKSECVTAS